ncbi:Hypothetical predicted protein, partial [Olea europaea subsp. europaea]
VAIEKGIGETGKEAHQREASVYHHNAGVSFDVAERLVTLVVGPRDDVATIATREAKLGAED